MYKPPFTITNLMLSLCISITEKVGQINNYQSLKRLPILRKNNRIKSIHSSLAIEANSLSINQVKDVIEGKIVIGPRKEIQEVKNAYNIYNMFDKFDCFNENDLLKAHEILTYLVDEESGKYRNHAEGVFDGDKVIFVAPPENMVPILMKDLFDWLKNDKETPLLIKSCVFHYEFVFIHPFGDGNGRTARALSYMMLIQSGYEFFRYFSISNLVSDERGKYYRSMVNVEEDEGDMTYFIDFYSNMLSRSVIRMEDHLTHHVLAGQRVKELQSSGLLNERQLAGVKWLLEGVGDSVTVDKWKKRYKVVQETARKDLMKLCDMGVLEKKMDGRRSVFKIIR